jgi:hypothetical protein
MKNRTELMAYTLVLLGVSLACNSKGSSSTDGAAPGAAPEPFVVTNAQDLAKEYHANEVAADEKFKGKRVRVAARVQSIDKDAFDNIIVQLATDNQFQAVMATMKDEDKAAVAKLSKGQAVAVECRGAGMIIGSPTLRDCFVLLTDPKTEPKKK